MRLIRNHTLYIFFLMLFVFCLAIIPMNADAESVHRTGTSGTCSWTLYSNGTLSIAPTDGISGTLESYTSGNGPFYDYSRFISKIIVEPGVSANAGCYHLFYNLDKCTEMDLHNLDMSNATNICGMFKYCRVLTSIDVSSWDTSNVTNMEGAFSVCLALPSLNLSGWNTENVTNMRSMFSACSSLVSLNIAGWSTGNVTDMQSMFDDCSKLTSIDVSGFDMSKVENISNMFNGCEGITEFDFSSWSTPNLHYDRYFIDECSSLQKVSFGEQFKWGYLNSNVFNFPTDRLWKCEERGIILSPHYIDAYVRNTAMKETWERIDKYEVKYAVSIWGICSDVDENGDVIALTFGPAINADYTEDYVSVTHNGGDHSGKTKFGNEHRCIHDDVEEYGWTFVNNNVEIDPYIYECCCGDDTHMPCTAAVVLDIEKSGEFCTKYTGLNGYTFDNSDLTGSGNYAESSICTYYPYPTGGDGITDLSCLVYGTSVSQPGSSSRIMSKNYINWVSGSNLTYGGWPQSGVRALFNGNSEEAFTVDLTASHDEEMISSPLDVAGVYANNGTYYPTDNLTWNLDTNTGIKSGKVVDQKSLLNHFPDDLINVIIPKRVVSCVAFKDLSKPLEENAYAITTYDKLWMPSVKTFVSDTYMGDSLMAEKQTERYERYSRDNNIYSDYFVYGYDYVYPNSDMIYYNVGDIRSGYASVSKKQPAVRHFLSTRSIDKHYPTSSGSVYFANGERGYLVSSSFTNMYRYSPFFCLGKAPQRYAIKYNGDFDSMGMMTIDSAECHTDFQLKQNQFYKYGAEFDHWEDQDGNVYADKAIIPANTFSFNEELILTAVFKPRDNNFEVNGDTMEFDLLAGEEMLIDNIPAGTSYEVWEETPTGWELVGISNGSGIIRPVDVTEVTATNKYSPGKTSASFMAFKTLDGHAPAADQFTFDLIDNGEIIQTVTCSEYGVIRFDPITYTEAGSYRYTIKERNEGVTGIEYDTHVENVFVDVKSDGEGGLWADVRYDRGSAPTFANRTVPGSLLLEKETINGNEFTEDDEFTFNITFYNESGVPVQGNYYYYYVDENGKPIVNSGNE